MNTENCITGLWFNVQCSFYSLVVRRNAIKYILQHTTVYSFSLSGFITNSIRKPDLDKFCIPRSKWIYTLSIFSLWTVDYDLGFGFDEKCLNIHCGCCQCCWCWHFSKIVPFIRSTFSFFSVCVCPWACSNILYFLWAVSYVMTT